MIFKNLTALCRQHKAIRLFGDPDELQWVSEGHAMYPLHGHPGMTAEVLPQLFDVREKDLGKYIIKHEIDLPGGFDYSDVASKEKELREEPITIKRAAGRDLFCREERLSAAGNHHAVQTGV